MVDNEERWELEQDSEEDPIEDVEESSSESETDPDWEFAQTMQHRLAEIMTNLPDLDETDGWVVANALSKTIEALEQLAESMDNILTVARTQPIETTEEIEQILRAFLPLTVVFPEMIARFLQLRMIVGKH